MTSTIALAAALLRWHEGVKSLAYDDADGCPLLPGKVVMGYASVGVGRNLCNRGLSPDEIDYLLVNDLATAEAAARKWLGGPVWNELPPERQAAILDLCHNVGPAGVLEFRRLRAAIASSDWPCAQREMLDSRWARQVPGRAARLASIMLTGEMPPHMREPADEAVMA